MRSGISIRKVKKQWKAIVFFVTNILPLIAILIVILSLVQGAVDLGEWITQNNIGIDIEDSNWVDKIDSEMFESSPISKGVLKEIVESEAKTYMSQPREFTLTYLTNEYKYKLNDKGNILLDDFGSPIYESSELVEKERLYNYDISDLTYEYRIPWQLIYAISIAAAAENEDIDLAVDEIENANTVNSDYDFKVTKRMVAKVVMAFETDYNFVYNYYGNASNYYSNTTLNGLPHTGNLDMYTPQTVFKKIETCLYDYNFSLSRSPYDNNNYLTQNITVVPQKERFIQALENVGCDEGYIDIILEIMAQLGGCDDYIENIQNVFYLNDDYSGGGGTGGNGVVVDLDGINLTEITKDALQYVGNRYVYGGTSLTHGIDCSAFVQAIYSKYGVSLPRTSREQARVGMRVSSISEALPGDLIFYATNGIVHHVAMYLGNNRIVHASNSKPYPAGGIKVTNNAQYQPIYVIRRVIN